MIPAALDNVEDFSLPTDFPENVVTAVESNVLRLHDRLSREYGIKVRYGVLVVVNEQNNHEPPTTGFALGLYWCA